MDPEKKKTIVVGSLFVAMLGIGAFQFTKGGGEVPPPTPAAEEKKPETEKSDEGDGKPKNPMYASLYSARDPFRPAAFSASAAVKAAPVNPSATPVPSIKPDGRAVPLPTAMPGGLPPMPLGDLPGGGSATQGVPYVAPKPTFGGTLIGVLVGARSAAVFRIGTSDRIVTLGSEIEPGVRLISVSARRAVLRFHGQTLSIELKDEAPAGPGPTSPVPPQDSPKESTPPTSAPTLPPTGPETTND